MTEETKQHWHITSDAAITEFNAMMNSALTALGSLSIAPGLSEHVKKRVREALNELILANDAATEMLEFK